MNEQSGLWQADLNALAGNTALIGVDEAGRGALAGPVMAAAVVCEKGFYKNKRIAQEAARMNDSKQLSAVKRTHFCDTIIRWRDAGLLRCAWAEGSVSEIAELNILGATRLAIQRALESLGLELHKSVDSLPLFERGVGDHRRILIDGRPLKPFPYAHEGVVKGDGIHFCIAAASILAKVQRDKRMVELCKTYPAYGFSRHKGYGSKTHCTVLKTRGPCPEHRSLFLRKVLHANLGKPDTENPHVRFDERGAGTA